VNALRPLPSGLPPVGEYDLGAVTVPRQLEIVERQLTDALAKGAHLAAGGRRRGDRSGNFFEPTLLLGATQEMDVVREETFGPLVAVVRTKDAAEALRRANDSHLGLNATVFGAPDEAMAFARQLESGQVITNDVLVNYIVVEAPLGGWKASGLGVRHGIEGVRQWTRTQAITVRRPLLAPVERLVARLLAFPYDRRVLAALRRTTRLLYRRGLAAKLAAPRKARPVESGR
jgi:acyl-CoA reductase-like NAD-dependent aldehyde dehydrogenase